MDIHSEAGRSHLVASLGEELDGRLIDILQKQYLDLLGVKRSQLPLRVLGPVCDPQSQKSGICSLSESKRTVEVKPR